MTGGAPTRVLLAGSTGLIGRDVAARLSALQNVELVSLVRRPSGSAGRVIDFEALVKDPAGAIDVGRIDFGISCLGTTMRTAGSRNAFRRVDHDYVVAIARAAKAAGAKRFVLVSSVGASGGGLYLQVKGEAEAAVAALAFDRLDVIRPGLLIGERTERRPMERLAQAVAPLLDPLLRGGLARYASIRSEVVAAAIERLALMRQPGHFIHHGPELRRLAEVQMMAT